MAATTPGGLPDLVAVMTKAASGIGQATAVRRRSPGMTTYSVTKIGAWMHTRALPSNWRLMAFGSMPSVPA